MATKDKSNKKTNTLPAGNVRMNVNIPKSFYKQIKQRALHEDKTVKDIVMKALEEYLNK